MSEQLAVFVDVIIPVAIPRTLTYRVPKELFDYMQVGVRVIVPLGKTKRYSAIVQKVHDSPPTAYTAKYIETVLDESPILTSKQLKFWKWMSEYYCCTLGEVMGAAMPSSLKLASETKVVLREEMEDLAMDNLSDKEIRILNALELHKEMDVQEISELLDQKSVLPLINKLIKKGWILSFEELQQKYRPKTEKHYQLTEAFQNDEALEVYIAKMERRRAHKKVEALLAHLRQAPAYTEMSSRKQILSNGVKSHSIKALVDDQVLQEILVLIDPFAPTEESGREVVLSEDQTKARKELDVHFADKDVCLLHGVTGSGKTEVYIEMIRDVLESGQQALMLIPEIGLTTQLIQRLEAYFPGEIAVYHSKFNMRERTEVWNEVMQGRPRLVVGARSSIFLPFQHLQLIIVDEEHESSYKQHHPAPRYQARDSAVVLAKLYGAKVILGSATPSIESYWNAEQGKFGLVEMTERFGGITLPEIFCADLRKEMKRKSLQGHFSYLLREEMQSAFAIDKQVILFQNRRGYAPLWQCHTCGWVPQCERCDVSLTYHKHKNQLNCHYCGYTVDPPKSCKVCGSSDLRNKSFGTEMIEEELQDVFPNAKVMRMDLDTTRSKNAYQKMLEAFDHQEVDVLVGTQMVSKGLDFDHVQLVGILNADMMLNYPDFRAFEKSYQLMSQVAGRAGRRGDRGKVVIQTYDPEHWVIQKVIANDYKGLYQLELLERKQYRYPPFYRLIKITLRHRKEHVVEAASRDFAEWLRVKFGERILGPESPHIARINNQYLRQILIKLERTSSPTKLKKGIIDLQNEFMSLPDYKQVRIILDVDPV